MDFFLLMQFVWRYIDDMVGKGIEWYYIVELLFYMSAGVVPLALPISVLLSSIMTMGGLAEHYELAAFKSGGISLYRIMRPLIIFLIFMGVGTFYFYNYVIPVANFKGSSLLKNIAKQKPALNIPQSVFYSGISGYTIRIGEKSSDENPILKDVYIYDHSENRGNVKVTTAETGQMQLSQDEDWLILSLQNGNTYEERKTKKKKEKERYPFMKSSFQSSEFRLPLTEFKNVDLKEERQDKNSQMLNTAQLEVAVDSLKDILTERQGWASFSNRERYHHLQKNYKDQDKASKLKPRVAQQSFKEKIPPAFWERTFENALRMARVNKEISRNFDEEFIWRRNTIATHKMDWHKKFALSFMCVLLFFIGAPLGAIIRKGGMGAPVVVSVLVFILFYVLNISFEKMGKKQVLEPWAAIWLSSLVLLPFGILLTRKSANDSSILNSETYSRILKNFYKLFTKSTKKKIEGSHTH